MFSRADLIAGFDPELAKAIADETRRQEDHVELIASENYASPRVMEAQGSQLTNKYAEGYPGKRYYGIPARRPTRRCISRCCSRVTPSSGCRWRTVAT